MSFDTTSHSGIKGTHRNSSSSAVASTGHEEGAKSGVAPSLVVHINIMRSHRWGTHALIRPFHRRPRAHRHVDLAYSGLI